MHYLSKQNQSDKCYAKSFHKQDKNTIICNYSESVNKEIFLEILVVAGDLVCDIMASLGVFVDVADT